MSFEFNLLGIPVRVTSGAFLLAAIIVIFGLQGGSVVGMVAFLVVVFASLLVHEYGHVMAFRAFGVPVRMVTLETFGGRTHPRGRPDKAWKALVVSLAGPVAGFVLALLARGTLIFGLPPTVELLATYFLYINVIWGVFNLLPIFPMDGGQALRSILAMFMEEVRALTISAWTGLLGSVALALGALAMQRWWIAAIGGMIAGQNWQVIQSIRTARTRQRQR